VLALAAGPALGRDPSGERVAALLVLMQADLARPAGAGIRARLLENASVLPIMLREAAASGQEVARARRIHPQLRQGRTRDARRAIDDLARRHPFRPQAPAEPPARLRALGRDIHRQACAGCHDHPVPGVLLPAENLYNLACVEPYPLLEARLYLGVKGMADAGYRNPFDARERAALASWYRSGCAR
jgi:cytochrome c5